MISFFSDWNFITGADYSHREDCIHVENIEFNPNTHDPVLIEKKWKFSVKLVEKPLPETSTSENQ